MGRVEELEMGKAAVERACSGDGNVLVISGVSGIGKTRLTEEIASYGRSLGMAVLAGASFTAAALA